MRHRQPPSSMIVPSIYFQVKQLSKEASAKRNVAKQKGGKIKTAHTITTLQVHCTTTRTLSHHLAQQHVATHESKTLTRWIQTPWPFGLEITWLHTAVSCLCRGLTSTAAGKLQKKRRRCRMYSSTEPLTQDKIKKEWCTKR